MLNRPVVALLGAGLAFLLYLATLAPGLTWANFGADGGDLLAAAVVNGVPHPTGYPLYTLLLQGWLALLGALLPASDIAWRGNLLNAVYAAAAVAITADISRQWPLNCREESRMKHGEQNTRGETWPSINHSPRTTAVLSLFVALAWAASPLLWEQAIITEVYTLHSLLVVALGWILLVYRGRSTRRVFASGLVLGLGMAHHLTILLLVPAVLYLLLPDLHWQRKINGAGRVPWLLLVGGVLAGLLLYLRLPLTTLIKPPPPVNWGIPETAENFWWLVSGVAYRHYLFGVPLDSLLDKFSRWSLVISRQFTPLGFGVSLAGLYILDQSQPRLRNFVLLWVLPLSLYSIIYNTQDSLTYLLPVVWMLALLLPVGLLSLHQWSVTRGLWPASSHVTAVPLVLLALALWIGVSLYRLPAISLRQDDKAIRFVQGVSAVLEPGSLVFSSADAETFGLWYGTWASGEIAAAAPDLILVNVALYQFEWYRNLLPRLYPDLPGTGTARVADILVTNRGQRPIFFTEQIGPADPEELEKVGPIWRLIPVESEG